jgi:Bacterial Ig-like domain (group 3)
VYVHRVSFGGTSVSGLGDTWTIGGTGVFTGMSCQGGLGVVFELAPSSLGTWTEKVLYSFWGYIAPYYSLPATTDGANPLAGLTVDSSGNLYGTTVGGGSSSDNNGTVFELVANSDGTYTEKVLYSFSGGSDGARPSAPLVLGSAGQLFGTTQDGGASGKGTAFELSVSHGTYLKTLHPFSGSPNGAAPFAGLTTDSMGNLYGTTQAGGSSSLGTAFQITFCPSTATTIKVTSSPNPANAGDSHVVSATVADTCGDPAIGSVEFFEGATSLGTATLNSDGERSVTVEDADSLGIGTLGITAQYTSDFPDFAASSCMGSVTVNEPGAITTGSNTFSGNQIVNGSVSAQSFLGDGSALTNLNPASLSAGTAGINISGNAATATTSTTATNALKLGGELPSYFATAGTNSFAGNQTVNGLVSAQDFLGSGSGLTNLNPASLSPGTAAAIATTAANALDLGGHPPGFYATTGADSFAGDQKVTGSIAASGGLTGASVSTPSLTLGSSGAPIKGHVSVVFQSVAFDTKMHPTTCTVWSGAIPSAADGDTVVAALSDSLMSSDIVFSAWATNGNVNVRICNPTGKPTDMGAGSIRIDLWKH